MKIAIGDSFTYGEELDSRDDAWPSLLGFENYGLRGASNEYIFRKAIEFAVSSTHMIISWSECTRYDLFTNIPTSVAQRYKNYTGPIQINSGWATAKNPWNQFAMPWFRDLYINYTDEKYSFLKTLSYMVSLQDVLDNNSVEYIFCSAFSNQELFKKYENDEEIVHWTNRLNKEKFVGFPDEGFVEWVYGTPHGEGGHPLKLGHKKIADKLSKYI